MVSGFEAAASHETEPGEIFIMAGPRAVTLQELANEIAACLEVPQPRLKLPKAAVWAGCLLLESGFKLINREPPFTRRSLKFYTGNTAFRTDKAQKALGFRADIDLSEGMRVTRDWYLENRSE
jgi:nucleoside-diphosphate-sugar epimerase